MAKSKSKSKKAAEDENLEVDENTVVDVGEEEGKEKKPPTKEQLLSTAIKQLEKKFGKGTVMRLGENVDNLNIEVVSTGILPLDLALGVGGIPKGRVVELFGPESSGKTTVALHIIAEVQKNGGIAAFIDAEHALDPVYAGCLGVDIDNLLVSQPDDGEQALEVAEKLIASGAVDLVVIDSVAALVPKAELDGDMVDVQVGLHARLMSKAMRKLTGVVSKTKSIIVFINQVREKVGSYMGGEVTTGGKALKFYSSVRIEVRRGETLKVGSEMIGNRAKVKIMKNKVAPPFRLAEFDIIYGEGVSKLSTVIDMAVLLNIMSKAGAYYYYNGVKLGQGKENSKKFLAENPEMLQEIEKKIREQAEAQNRATDDERARKEAAKAAEAAKTAKVVDVIETFDIGEETAPPDDEDFEEVEESSIEIE